MADEAVSLDLNSPVFQRDLFALDKRNQNAVLSTLKRIHAMTWNQLPLVPKLLAWEPSLGSSCFPNRIWAAPPAP